MDRTSPSRLFRALLLTIAVALPGGQPSIAALSESPGADWYNPPPSKYREVSAEMLIPTELIAGVSPKRLEEASALLGGATVREIKAERAAYLASMGDPGVVIQKKLEEARKKMQLFVERRKRGHNDKPEQIRAQLLSSDIHVIEELKREIAGYEKWAGDLKPYLIKAVSLGGGSGPFFGAIVGDKLFVSYVAVGQDPLPITRMPVVAYLPRKPQHVYHIVSGMQ